MVESAARNRDDNLAGIRARLSEAPLSPTPADVTVELRRSALRRLGREPSSDADPSSRHRGLWRARNHRPEERAGAIALPPVAPRRLTSEEERDQEVASLIAAIGIPLDTDRPPSTGPQAPAKVAVAKTEVAAIVSEGRSELERIRSDSQDRATRLVEEGHVLLEQAREEAAGLLWEAGERRQEMLERLQDMQRRLLTIVRELERALGP